MLSIAAAACGEGEGSEVAPQQETTTAAPSSSDATRPGALAGSIANGGDVVFEEVQLEAGEALRVAVQGDNELEPHVAIYGAPDEFDLRRNDVDPLDLTSYMTSLGVGRSSITVLEQLMSRFDDAGLPPGRPLVGSTTLYRETPESDGSVASNAWAVFVAPETNTYSVVITAWNEQDAATGQFEAIFETSQGQGGAGRFGTSTLTEDEYEAAISRHDDFLLDPAFFAPERYFFDGDGVCDAESPDGPPPTCVEGEPVYYGPVPL